MRDDGWRPAAVDAVAALARWYAQRQLKRLRGAPPDNDAPANDGGPPAPGVPSPGRND